MTSFWRLNSSGNHTGNSNTTHDYNDEDGLLPFHSYKITGRRFANAVRRTSAARPHDGTHRWSQAESVDKLDGARQRHWQRSNAFRSLLITEDGSSRSVERKKKKPSRRRRARRGHTVTALPDNERYTTSQPTTRVKADYSL